MTWLLLWLLGFSLPLYGIGLTVVGKTLPLPLLVGIVFTVLISLLRSGWILHLSARKVARYIFLWLPFASAVLSFSLHVMDASGNLATFEALIDLVNLAAVSLVGTATALCVRGQQELDGLWSGWAVSTILMAMWALVEYLVPGTLPDIRNTISMYVYRGSGLESWVGMRRAYGLYPEPLGLGVMNALALPLVIGPLRGRWPVWAVCAGAVLLVVTEALSFSRIGWAAMGLGGVTWLILSHRGRLRMARVARVAVAVVLLLGAVAYLEYRGNMVSQVLDRFRRFEDLSAEYRWASVVEGLELFWVEPFRGVGPGNVQEVRPGLHVLSLLVYQAAQTGLPGIAAWSLLIGGCIVLATLRAVRSNALSPVAIASLNYAILPVVSTTPDYGGLYLWIPWALSLGALHASGRALEDFEKRP